LQLTSVYLVLLSRTIVSKETYYTAKETGVLQLTSVYLVLLSRTVYLELLSRTEM